MTNLVILSVAKNLMYYVYIATNRKNTVLYTGVTNNLIRRIHQHREGLVEGFTKKYNIHKLVYYDIFDKPYDAIVAEKKIKGWLRNKKLELIKDKNPNFEDLLNFLKDPSSASWRIQDDGPGHSESRL